MNALSLIVDRYKYAFDAIVISLLVAGTAWGVHTYNAHQQDLGASRVQAQWDKQLAADKASARAREIQLQKEKDDAEIKAQERIAAADAAANAAAHSSRVLDSTLKAILARSSTDSVEANRKYAAALAAVFGDCKDEYRKLGREAQGHADDSLKLQQAWPK